MAGSLTHVWSWEFEGEDFSAGTCSLLAKLSGRFRYCLIVSLVLPLF